MPDRALQLPQDRAGIGWAVMITGYRCGRLYAVYGGRAGDYSYPRDLRAIQFCMPGRLEDHTRLAKATGPDISRLQHSVAVPHLGQLLMMRTS
jgi:hypothetical protein